MKPEEQRIAVAKACGWRKLHKRNSKLRKSENGTLLAGHHPDHDGMSMIDGWCNANLVPDYLNDLNAMHEAEKSLTPEQEESYLENLDRILGQSIHDDPRWHASNLCSTMQIYRATASQRAEAFLRTLNLWTVEPSN